MGFVFLYRRWRTPAILLAGYAGGFLLGKLA